MTNDRTRERKTYPFFRQRPIFSTEGVGVASVPTGTGFRHVTAGTEYAAAKLVEDADVDVAAAIASTKLSFAGSTPITFAMSITASGSLTAVGNIVASSSLTAVGNIFTSASLGVTSSKFSTEITIASLQTSSTFSTIPTLGSVLFSASLGDFESLDFDATIMASNMRGFRRSTMQMTAMRASGSANYLVSTQQRPVPTVTGHFGSYNEAFNWTENLRYVSASSKIQLEVTGTGIVDWSSDIRIRRNKTYFTSLSSSLDAAPITYASYLLAWYRSTDVVTNASAVTKMTDKSGNGRHIGQGGSTSIAPTLETAVAAMGGFDTVNFDGSTQFLSGTMWNLAGSGVGYTIFAAYIPVAQDLTDAIWDLSSTDNVTNTYCEHAFGGNGIRFGPTTVMTFTDPSVSVGTYDTVSIGTGSWEHSEFWLKGVSKATTSTAPGTRPLFIRVGSLFQDVWFYNVKLAELLIFSGTLPTSGRQDVESYLAARYGL